ncbi:ATP-binding protein [Streptacidiphilus anmyonensis]|uniref:nSTAND3 domain-containing NTPase n=1 Tax=Streptacidiphilus anmyonensis TaxID=405782 RepID=UPI000A9587D8|nr:ATP-binding protein [Streptacidiphilus anmyonensis]
MHTGSGDQYVYYVTEQLTRDARGRTPRRLAEEELAWLRERFVYPDSFAAARRTLAAEHLVILSGPAGCGRTSAARMLLHELRGDARPFYELIAEDDDEERARDLASVDVGPDARLLLDLSETGGRFWPDIRSQLESFRERVRWHRAHLVVVLPATAATPLPEALERFRVAIEAAERPRVLRRYLTTAGIRIDDGTPPALAEFLHANRPLHEVAAVAQLIVQASERDDGQGDFADWCAAAVDAAADRSDEVAQLVHRLRDGSQRALLLVTAMLHEAHGDAVDRGTTALLTVLSHPQDQSPLLERTDLFQRLDEVGARTAADGRVRFERLGFDKAVREHFWRYLQGVRPALSVWVADEIGAPELTDADRDALVKRFADQCLSTGDRELLCELVPAWTTSPDGRQLRAAAQVLEHGLKSREHGRSFRRRIYHWSLESQNVGLTAVLVGVCAEVMAIRHPDQALVRLHHLARRQHRGTSAQEALLRLASGDRWLHRLLLRRIAAAPLDRPWRADTELFLALADPSVLITDSTLRKSLVLGWCGVFTARRLPDWQETACRWFDLACEAAGVAELLTGVLVDACDGKGDHLGRLYTAARDWAHRSVHAAPESARHAVTTTLRQRIDAVQGFSVA